MCYSVSQYIAKSRGFIGSSIRINVKIRCWCPWQSFLMHAITSLVNQKIFSMTSEIIKTFKTLHKACVCVCVSSALCEFEVLYNHVKGFLKNRGSNKIDHFYFQWSMNWELVAFYTSQRCLSLPISNPESESVYCEAKRAERSMFATLCVFFLTMESENQGLQSVPLLSKFHSQYRNVPLLSKFHSLKLHIPKNFRGRPAYKCLGKKALEA